jgi:hypothetical protein
MSLANYPHGAEYLRAVRDAFAHTSAGGTVRVSWASQALDASAWRAEFLAALDRRLTARMPRPTLRACRCKHCTHRCDCSARAQHERGRVPDPVVADCARGCTRGRKLDEDYQRALQQDCQDVRDHATRRRIVRQLRTRDVRERFVHYLYASEES